VSSNEALRFAEIICRELCDWSTVKFSHSEHEKRYWD
jgi:hypothetical protein